MINKIAPSFSKPSEGEPILDENGVPIPGEHSEGSNRSEGPKKNEFGHTYNNAPNIQHPHVNNLGNPPLVDRSDGVDDHTPCWEPREEGTMQSCEIFP